MPNSQNVKQKSDDPSGIALYSTLLYILVSGAKGVLAWLSGSSALLADTIHGFSDAFASILVLVGIWLSGKRSEAFPWGLYKVENLVALVSAGFIFLAGYEIVRHAFVAEKAFPLSHLFISIMGLLIIIVIIAFFSKYEKKKAKDLNSPSLLADASHWYSDIASTALVLVALLGAKIGYPLIDRLAALAMVGFIAKVGWNILKDSMKTLLDASVDPDTLNRIRDTIQRFSQVKKIESIQARNSGRFVFVRAEIVFDVKKFTQAHHLSEEIEKALLKEIPHVDKVMIHYEPLEKDFLIYAVPVDEDRHKLSEHLGGAPYFYLIRVRAEGHMIQEEKILPNPYLKDEKGKGIKVSEWLLQNGVDAVLTRKAFEGKGPFYVFSSSEVDVIPTEAKTIEEIHQNLAKIGAP
jgi:cation diffusion facilitator family transporter